MENGENRVSSPEKSGRTWVQFNEENSETLNGHPQDDHVNAAVIEPTVEIHSPLSNKSPGSLPSSPKSQDNLQTVELHNSQDNQVSATTSSTAVTISNGNRRNNSGFTNGDVIVSILPVNTNYPWITPASFRPELVPEELMAPGLTLTVEEYVHAMELLTSDVRFNAYTICYKRLLASWLTAAFFILLIILFSGVVGIHLFALGISWLIINAAAVFFCMYLKIKINQGLERCMGRVNKITNYLLDWMIEAEFHVTKFIYASFILIPLNASLEHVLDSSQDRQRMQNHLDARDVEIVITGTQNTTRIPQKQSEVLYLRYLQRYAKAYLRELAIGKDMTQRHCPKQQCPCQFVEDVLQEKRTGLTGCCSICQNLSYAIPNTLTV